MIAYATTCAGCAAPFGPTARPVRLRDLAFHEICAPRCQACGKTASARDESNWSYSLQVIPDWYGYRVEPTTFWCEDCWKQSDRGLPDAQD